MPRLNLSADALLSTTRAVRRRLDFDRDVEHRLIEECIRLAQQAPSASGSQVAHFVVVTEPAKKAALAELWRSSRDFDGHAHRHRHLPAEIIRGPDRRVRPAPDHERHWLCPDGQPGLRPQAAMLSASTKLNDGSRVAASTASNSSASTRPWPSTPSRVRSSERRSSSAVPLPPCR